MVIKAGVETLDRDSFIAEARKKDIQSESIWSSDNLNKLSNDDLIDRLEQIESQSMLIKWRILWTLRQRFSSDTLFGKYLASLKSESTRYIIASGSKTITKSIHAGRFCEKHKITSLEDVGLLPSSIYALSRPIYEDISDNVFKKVKKKNLPNKEVEQLLEQAKAVFTIEQPKCIDYKHDSTEHDVSNNVHVITESKVINSVLSPINIVEVETEITEPVVKISTKNTDNEPKSNHQRRLEILATLPPLDDETPDDEIILELEIIKLIYDKQVSKLNELSIGIK